MTLLRGDCAIPFGEAVQVDPMKPKLKPPETEHMKLKCDMPLSNFAFNFNLHRYTSDAYYGGRVRSGTPASVRPAPAGFAWPLPGRGLHSSTLPLNGSTFC